MDNVDQGTILLIAAIVLGALFVFALFRRLVKMAIIVMLLAVVLVGLYVARAQDLITW
jgi:uncharacterized membrane protein